MLMLAIACVFAGLAYITGRFLGGQPTRWRRDADSLWCEHPTLPHRRH